MSSRSYPERWHSARTEANARLTSTVGLVLLVLLAVQGLTIVSIHRLLTAHVVIGLALAGPLAVKLGSTGWRFIRYYTNDRDYVRAGPPHPLLRILAPILVIATLAVFASGIALLFVTPGTGSLLFLAHKLSFVAWFAVMTVHVLGYTLPAVRRTIDDLMGNGSAATLATRRLRWLLVGGGLAAGVILGGAGLSWAHAWAVWSGAARQ